jgi:hypothetical protein
VAAGVLVGAALGVDSDDPQAAAGAILLAEGLRNLHVIRGLLTPKDG